MRIEGNRIVLEGRLTRETVPDLHQRLERRESGVDEIDLTRVEQMDSAGAAFVQALEEQAPNGAVRGANSQVAGTLALFKPVSETPPEADQAGPLERLGRTIERVLLSVREYTVLASEILYWGLLAPFTPKSRRSGSVAEQCERIGVSAVPIIGFLSLILGVIVVLQSAAQLQRFGAALFVADLLGISVVRETGPLFTAIIVAGRSGSSITAQLATMKVTQELDALRVMALDPIRYVIVPMLLGMMLTIPVLTAFSILIGITGGTAVATLSNDLSVVSFLSRLADVIDWTDLFVGISKSLFFGLGIVFTASYFGLTADGGSEGVGSATTRSVVVSIFVVIALNALFSLLYLI